MKKSHLLVSLALIVISCTKAPVVTDIPLKEHPRPDFERAVWQNLNGYWRFAPDSANVGERDNWQNTPDKFPSKILVPFSWASPMSGVALPKVNVGWYSRNFPVVGKEWAGKDIYIVFGASDFYTKVWINGKVAGEHKGGYVPFEFNITEYLKRGNNEIVVRVEDEELDNRPSGKQYYGNAKGIWQTVYLEPRSSIFISALRFTPDIDNSKVNVSVDLSAPAPEGLVFRLTGKGNGINFESPVEKGKNTASWDVPVESVKLWSPDDPFLYEVNASVAASGIDDNVSSYFGMRKFSAVRIPGKDFEYVALNNKPIYLKLTLDQSYHPEGFYTFPSDQFMKEEILRAKELGINGLRIHIKAEIPRKLYWADKLGLLIMEDIPNFWGEPTKEAKANWEYVAENEIRRDYNHPSIFSWVLFNETWGLFSRDSVTGKRSYTAATQDWVRSWYHKAKTLDPTRLVEDNSPCNLDHVITDLNTWHSYNPARQWAGLFDEIVSKTYPGSTYNYIGGNVQGNEPMLNSECGAVWGYSGSTGDIDLTWEYHIMMNEFRKRPKIAGYLFTEFHDVINEWNGYYRFDRTKKDFGFDELCPGMTMKDLQQDLYVVAGDDFFKIYKGGSSVLIPVGVSAVTSTIPENLKVEYSVYGWDETGEKFDWTRGEIPAMAEPFSFVKLDPVSIKLPDLNSVMIFATRLKDGAGNTLQKNFVPFRVGGKHADGLLMISQSPASFKNSSWSIRQLAAQNGRKVWGMGTGFFEYEFPLPANLDTAAIKSLEFRAELAARYPQEKYLEEGAAEGIGMTVMTDKGRIPGYGKNSYPQTDEKKYSSKVAISINGEKSTEVSLPDDPADHRGILSWVNQEPGWAWGSTDRSKKWLLDEAGSYGYLVTAALNKNQIKKAVEAGKILIRLQVDEYGSNNGGLSVYGKESGRFPFDPAIFIKK
ncbi:MAG TPA: glycoside hydrolase family 2 TIM barrel-domain containing protein [Bacteroidales bacterium]|nr:glycoside hydrolase family 2 TIM barrel-domain containing protein [Bacteroidales bacterium]